MTRGTLPLPPSDIATLSMLSARGDLVAWTVRGDTRVVVSTHESHIATLLALLKWTNIAMRTGRLGEQSADDYTTSARQLPPSTVTLTAARRRGHTPEVLILNAQESDAIADISANLTTTTEGTGTRTTNQLELQ